MNSSIIQNNYKGDDEDHTVTKINFDHLLGFAFNPNRFAHVATLVVDQSMPVMSGMDFCQQIYNKNTSIKKIMLTGEAGPSLAVEAFNKGLIDQFIVKATSNMTSLLRANIEKLQWEYFTQLSEYILTMLRGNPECALFNSCYQKIVHNYFLAYPYSEFYLIDETGSFVFIKSNGDISWLIVRSVEEMLRNYELARDYSNEFKLPDIFLNDLKHFRSIPFLFTDEQFALPISDWVKYSHQAKPVNDNNYFYYSIIESAKGYISEDDILSFSEYLNSY
jgi:CheY-like chemotaxis protein